MLVYVLDKQYRSIDVLDTFIELIWTVRYRNCGDFELYLPVNYCTNPNLAKGNYLYLPGSDRYMILEDSETTTARNGDDPSFKLIGRSLESILDRRVIWNQIDFTGTVHDLVKRILNENVIYPTKARRAIPNFTFVDSSGGRMGESITAQYHGENVMEIIEDLCANYGLGYKVLPSGEGGFSFTLYNGADRSYSQNTNPWVVFSPKYENLQNTLLVEKNSAHKNSACVYNEYTKTYSITSTVQKTDSGGDTYEDTVTTQYSTIIRTEAEVDGGEGLDRKEIYVESNASHTREGSDEDISQNEFQAMLHAEGEKELKEYKTSAIFTGSVEAKRQFVLGRDFNLGDIVSIENEYGQKGRCRAIEVIYSHSKNGESVLPSFENVDENGILIN